MNAALTSAGLQAQLRAISAKPTDEPKSGVEAQARKAAQGFESVFLNTMLEGMFTGLKTDLPGGGGKSENVYRSMMVGEYAKQISANGGLGIADQVYREILAVQENSRK